jgi:hypothetical protein
MNPIIRRTAICVVTGSGVAAALAATAQRALPQALALSLAVKSQLGFGSKADSSIPGFILAICFGSGLLLVAVAIPLWRRRVPPNGFYGVRFRSTLQNDDIWYEVNSRGGRNLLIIGIGYLALLSLTLFLGHAWTIAARLLVPTGFLVLALILNTILLHNAASRLVAERDRRP